MRDAADLISVRSYHFREGSSIPSIPMPSIASFKHMLPY